MSKERMEEWEREEKERGAAVGNKFEQEWGGDLAYWVENNLKHEKGIPEDLKVIVSKLEKAFITEKREVYNDYYVKGKITEDEMKAEFSNLDEGIRATRSYMAGVGLCIEQGIAADLLKDKMDKLERDYRQVIKPLSLSEKFMLLIDQLIEAVGAMVGMKSAHSETKTSSEYDWSLTRYPVKQTTDSLVQAAKNLKGNEPPAISSDESGGSNDKPSTRLDSM